MSGKRTVLVVDDDVFNLELVATILERGGYDVVGTASGGEALELAATLMPSLVLMDLQLPGMDGLEVTRRLLESPRTSRLKIVAYSAMAMPDDIEAAMRAGCSAYITKPIGARQLIETVRSEIGE